MPVRQIFHFAPSPRISRSWPCFVCPSGTISRSSEAPAHAPRSRLLRARFPTCRASCSRAKGQATAHVISRSPTPPAHVPRPGRAPHCCASPSPPRSNAKSPSQSPAAKRQVRMANPSRRSSSNVPNWLHQFIMPWFIGEGSNELRWVLPHDGLRG
jgi:hypothetical protein